MRSPKVEFPSVELADPETGLLCVGGDLSVETLVAAYQKGIFPWPLGEGEELYWFAPARRAVLFFDNLHIPRRLQRARRKHNFFFRRNEEFDRIVEHCAESRKKLGKRTWVTSRLQEAYGALFRAGYASCLSCYSNDELIAGIYGVRMGRMFAGESMFTYVTDASKFVLLELVDVLKTEGVSWIDCQQQTPLLGCFGANIISRDEFSLLLSKALL